MGKTLLTSFLLLILVSTSQNVSAQMITVFAGVDTTVCSINNLVLADLNPSIAGAVSDGVWVTSGDGSFLPNQASNHLYSTATHYVPGNIDRNTGSVTLTLVSDDPDDFGPITEQNDALILTLSDGVSMFCNNNVNVSLNPNCEQELLPQLLLSNAVAPYDLYDIEAYDENGALVLNNIVNADHVGQVISFGIFYSCNGNSCWGSVTVEDKLPPVFQCTDVAIPCQQEYSPAVLGLPISSTVTVDTIINNVYHVTGMDACGLAYLTYNDSKVDGACSADTSTIITRFWTATDEIGNQSFCQQRIYLERAEVTDIVLPVNYDDNINPAFECGGDWAALASGYPSPDTTGYPVLGNCDYIDVTYADAFISDCGNSYKIIREWKVIEWCYSQILTHNQVIKVSDHTAPYILCPSDVSISTNFGMCESDAQMISIDTLIDVCNSATAAIQIFNINNQLVHNASINNPNLVLIPSLDLGVFSVVITATDLCNNQSSCNFDITVADQIAPYAVCDEFTTVSLISNGTSRIYANSLDDGSHDDCSAVTFQVKKNDEDLCNGNTNYSNYIDFCCLEVDSTIYVTLMVTDMSGNTNECSVVVHVQDAVAPTITCPPNITISCSTDIDTSDLSSFGSVVSNLEIPQAIVINDSFNNGVVGYDGVYTDNCSASITETYSTDLTCNAGTIRRDFVVLDNFGLQMTCSQTITIVNDDPFDINDIAWPSDFDFSGCAAEMDSLSLVGEPILNSTKCSSVATSHTDQVFNTVDGACKKILRTWVVVDWCEYDAITSNGSWSYIQEIKQYNTQDPIIDSQVCLDTTVCIIDGCEVMTMQSIFATDDCSAATDIIYTWSLDIDNDNIIDTTGYGDAVDVLLLRGEHILLWTVEDGCGNTSSCDQKITVVDCKAPTPYCRNEITTVIMPANGTISIWANEFNIGSYDNCDDSGDLAYSFDVDGLLTTREFSCVDILDGISQVFELDMWVTDLSGNKEFCTVQVNIQDNNGDVCVDLNQEMTISGFIMNTDGYVPVGTQVTASNTQGVQGQAIINNDTDPFEMDLLSGETYTFDCVSKENFAVGLSALDILIIQKHILDILPLNDPYKLIAADINNSGSVSSIDLAELQKLILGKVDTLRFNDSWVFVPEDHIFIDINNPWSYPRELDVTVGATDIDTIDFTAIKVGDVNRSLQSFNSQEPVESRNNLSILKSEIVNNAQEVFIESSDLIEGIQLALAIDDETFDLLTISDDVDYHYSDGVLKMLLIDADGINAEGRVYLFSIPSSRTSHISMTDVAGFQSFYINDEVAYAINDIKWSNALYNHNDIDFDVYPNPFSDIMNVVLPANSNDKVVITVTDIRGNAVLSREYVNQQSLVIRKSDLKIAGVYFLNVQMETHSITKRIVLQF